MHHLTPHFIIEKFKHGLHQGQFLAASLFIDISGFTEVTEALMAHQQYGVEALARIMRAIFDPLAASIYHHGGFIGTCAGDAITALFPIEPEQPVRAYQRALAAAWAIREHLRTATQKSRYGTFHFTAKTGLGGGRVEWGIITGPTAHQNACYFKGPAVESCAQAEHYAIGGDIILSRDVYHQLRPAVEVDPLAGTPDFVKLKIVEAALPEPGAITLPEITPEQAAAFHPLALIQQRASGEFRHALNVFVNLADLNSHDQLAQTMQVVFTLQQQYGGYLNRIDFGDKGCHLLLFWGAPVAYETDIERALTFLLDLQAALTTPLRAGVTYRISHAGFIGSKLREEYTCYGRGINLAARLMTHAPWGQIWLDEEMVQRADPDFASQFIDNMSFKGFADPMAVYQLLGRRAAGDARLSDEPIIGRETELDRLLAAIAPIFAGRFAGVITVHGEAGIGKSRLLDELHRSLTGAAGDPATPSQPPPARGRSQDFPPSGGDSGGENRGQPHLSALEPPDGGEKGQIPASGELGGPESVPNSRPLPPPVRWFYCPADEILRRPLNPFRYWLRHYFQQADGHSEADNKARFRRILDQLLEQVSDTALRAELDQFAVYLGGLVDLHWPDSPYEQSDPKLRFENTLRAIKNLIKAEASRQPVVLELEDAHWLDRQSQELVTLLTRNIERLPLVVICAARYGDDGSQLQLPLDDDVRRQAIDLTYFNVADSQQLAQELLDGQISDHFGQFLVDKSRGNPFFIKQLILDLKERGALIRRERGGRVNYVLNPLRTEEVPADIRTILISRLDRLPWPVKHVVQVASVLGPEFEVPVLAQILPGNQQLNQHLRYAETEQVWVGLNGDRYLFKHALLRDSAYSMQVSSQLRSLHRRGAEALETLYAHDLPRHYTALAYHYERAELAEKSIIYLERAGDQAKANYQNENALTFFDRLLQYRLDRAKQMMIYSKQGEILNLQGEWDLALAKLQQGLAQLQGLENTRHEAQLRVVLADVLLTKGAHDTALAHLEMAQEIAETVQDPEILFKTLITLARNYMYKLEPERALAMNQQALALAQALGDEYGAAMAMAGMGAVHAMRDEADQALPNLLASIPIFKKLGDKREMIHPLFNTGVVYHTSGDYDQALSYFHQVIEEAAEIGDRVGVWLALHFIGHIHHSAGRHQQAIPFFLEALQKRAETGEDGLISQTEPYLATAYASLGRPAAALSAARHYFEKLAGGQRDVEQGRAHVAVGMVLSQLIINRQPANPPDASPGRPADRAALCADLKAIGQLTGLPLNPNAYFQQAIAAAQTGSRPYPMTLIPALYEYGRFLYRTGQREAGLARLAEAKAQALQLKMRGKIARIKDACADLGLDFDALG
ncbi:MAG: tetratricopeptide repeat protein [Anaerolineaceae bacterium]|nr:tetratricopeptide repeat protein [Anaerolineaceae bacterium]MCB9098374.1 tetratricopeptide repeat protein [Anaerolineales bacterium]